MSSAKVAYLFMRTMAKPVANAVKNYAKTHPKFSERTIAMAQGVHRLETNLKRSLLDYQVDHVRPLTDARALEMGANFIGEATLFFLVAGVVVLETTRQAVSTKKKEAVQNQRIAAAEVAVLAREAEIAALKVELEGVRKEVEEVRTLFVQRQNERAEAGMGSSTAGTASGASEPPGRGVVGSAGGWWRLW